MIEIGSIIDGAIEGLKGVGYEVVDEPRLKEKLEKFKLDGIGSSVFLFDFDKCLSDPRKTSYTGIFRVMSTSELDFWRRVELEAYSHMEKGVGDDYNQNLVVGDNYPLKMDWEDSKLQEFQMKAWHENGLRLLLNAGITDDVFSHSVEQGFIDFRHGAEELLNLTYQFGGTPLVFSAGVQNGIEELLKSRDLKEIRVAANKIHLNGKNSSIDEEIFYTGVKNIGRLKEIRPDIFDYLSIGGKNKTVFIFGDNIQDAHMISREDEESFGLNVIRIGILNKKDGVDPQEYLARKMLYNENFDIVVEESDSMQASLMPICDLLNHFAN